MNCSAFTERTALQPEQHNVHVTLPAKHGPQFSFENRDSVFRENIRCTNIRNDNTSRICLIRHLKGIRKTWRFRRSDELCKQVKILSEKLVYFIIVTRIHCALICSKIQVYDVVVEHK